MIFKRPFSYSLGEGHTYQKIAQNIGYDADYIKDVGHKLWKYLSQLLGENVSKKNLCSMLNKYQSKGNHIQPQGTNLVEFSKYQKRKKNHETHYSWGSSPVIPFFIDRPQILDTLEAFVLDKNHQLVGIFGLGGVGKTFLAVKLTEQVQGYFDHIIWHSVRNPKPFSDFVLEVMETIKQDSPASLPIDPAAQIDLLIRTFQDCHCLLVLDNWSSILQAQKLVGAYLEEFDAYGFFLRRLSESRTNSCVVVTSREKPGGLAFKDHHNSFVKSLFLSGFNIDSGQNFLKKCGLTQDDLHLEELVHMYAGNPYCLRIVSHSILSLFGGAVASFIQRDNLIYGDIRHMLERQCNRLTVLERSIMVSMIDLKEWVSILELEEHLALSGQLDPLLEAVESLLYRSFVIQEKGFLNLSPLLRRYVGLLKGTSQPPILSSEWANPLYNSQSSLASGQVLSEETVSANGRDKCN